VPKIIIALIVFSSTIYSQLELSTYTDKDVYDYGETIKLYCKVTNTADTTIEFFAPTYQSCQAEFSFNDFKSSEHTACLATSELLTFLPTHSKIYSWVIEPNNYGLPNLDGTQTIIGHYYFDLKDTIRIQAPLFLGGKINVGFFEEKTDSVIWIKDSLNVNVLEHHQFENTISEKWEINGHQIDSVINYLISTDLFLYAENAVFVEYENIFDDDPIDYYPMQVGNQWYYDVKYIPVWSSKEINYNLSREVIKDTILSNGKSYFQVKELRSDTNLVKFNYERIDSVNGKVYQFSEFAIDSEFIKFDLISQIDQSFITLIEFYGAPTTELMYLTDQGQEE
jgi:hypothetical protein